MPSQNIHTITPHESMVPITQSPLPTTEQEKAESKYNSLRKPRIIMDVINKSRCKCHSIVRESNSSQNVLTMIINITIKCNLLRKPRTVMDVINRTTCK